MNKAKIALAIALIFIFSSVSGFSDLVRAEEARGDEIFITVLHTNDEHSAFVPFLTADEPSGERGGLARLATLIDAVRDMKAESSEPVLLLSGGDFLGETAYGWLSTWGYAPELECMQLMGYDAVTIGNHEYDFGPDILASYFRMAGYPEAHDQTMVLAANTEAPDSHALAGDRLILPSGIIELENGLEIGIFGLIGNDAISVASDPGEIEFADQVETARQMVQQLRDEGADLVIALSHSGETEDVPLAAEVEGIDIIIGGHSHTLLEEPIVENGTIIVQAGAQTRHLGYLEIAYNPVTKEVRTRNGESGSPYVLPVEKDINPHPVIQERVDFYTGILNEKISGMTGGMFADVHQALASSDFLLSNRPRLQETQVGDFITDGMRLVTEKITGEKVDLAVQANGSIRGGIVPKENGKTGELSFYDITNTIGLGYGQDGYPGYSVASVYLTGEEIRRVLEIAALLPVLMGDDYFLQFSGLSYEYNPQNTLFLTIPIIDQPIPTTRAVKRARIFTGSGIQPQDIEDEAYETLRKGDEKLYHLVTDTYILSFLPMAGEILPQLEVVPKNKSGEPVSVADLGQLTVTYAGRELKVWETAAMYAASLPVNQDDAANIPEYYKSTGHRIVPVKSFPLVVFPILALLLVLALIITPIVIIRRFRKARETRI